MILPPASSPAYRLGALLALLLPFTVRAFQGLYVDGFDSICTDPARSRNLLRTVRALGFDALTLYDLPTLEQDHGALDDTASESFRCLRAFVQEARRQGIAEVGGAFESMDELHHRLEGYQSHLPPGDPARLDAFVLEFEWWTPSYSRPGGTYCQNYLIDQGIACTPKGAWAWAARLMDSLGTVAARCGARSAVYASQFDAEQAAWISRHVHRVLLSDYIANPEGDRGWLQIRSRVNTLVKSGGAGELVVLWSAEGGSGDPEAWLGDWLAGRTPWDTPHPLDLAQANLVAAWKAEDPSGPDSAHLAGQQWFTWSDIQKNALRYRAWATHRPPQGFAHWVDPRGRALPDPPKAFQSRKALLVRNW